MSSQRKASYTCPSHVAQGELWDSVATEEKFSSPYFQSDSLLTPEHLLEQSRAQHNFSLEKSWTALTDKPPAIFSFFSGAGFLDLGFESRGCNVAYVNEFYSPFLEVHRYSRRNLNIAPPQYGYYEGSAVDLIEGQRRNRLTDLIDDARKNTNIVGFIGGPPCPDFSIGGKNKGSEGDNGKLSAIYIELICQQKPDFYLFENVKGLWQTKRHRAFYEELKSRTQQYYVTTECLNNAIEYGVPQDRDRIILLGFRKDLLSNIDIKTKQKEFFPWTRYVKYSEKGVFSSPWPTTNPFAEGSVLPPLDGIIEELTVEYWFHKNDVVNHPNSTQHFKPRSIERFTSILEGDDSKKSFKRLHRWRYSPTVCYGNNEVHLHPYKARRISVAESMAIQSLPRDFILPPSLTLTDLFKIIGNGVPYLMAEALAQTILDFLRVDLKTRTTKLSITSELTSY